MHSLIERSVRIYRIAAVLAVLFLVAAARLPAQAPPLDQGAGTLYYIAFPDTAGNRIDARFPNNRVVSEATLWLWSPVVNKVRITNDAGNTETVTLEPGRFRGHTVQQSSIVTAVNTALKKGIRVESDFPIMLYVYFAHWQYAEAWTPIPVESWGTRYSAATLPGEILRSHKTTGANSTRVPYTTLPAPATILVIAAFDNTKVTIKPPAGITLFGAVPATVTLNEGEVYQVQSRVDTSADVFPRDDIAATMITSDKPIGVLSGNTRAGRISDTMGLRGNAYRNMQMEWLPPADQYGSKFVWLPTWDQRRPNSGGIVTRKQEFARIYKTAAYDTTLRGSYLEPGTTTRVPFTMLKGEGMKEFAFWQPAAAYFETAGPAMAMMYSEAIVRQVSSTPTPYGIPAMEYEGWAPYMVTMVPREQWGSFAPYYAPTNPGAMQSFISVVTDTITAKSLKREDGTTFLLNRPIPGTDLIWGTMNVSPGEDHWLHAENGGTFYGVAFGLFRGEEKFRPGGGMAELEEYSALSYAYPIGARHRVLGTGDSLRIDTVMDCSQLRITIRAVNPDPSGLRSVTLDPLTVENAHLVPIDPSRLSDIVGRSQIELMVEPVDPLKNASATVIIKDRTGKLWRVYYTYRAELVMIDPPDQLDFDVVNGGSTVEKTVTITNPFPHPVRIRALRLVRGDQGYQIDGSTPTAPVDLAPGARMTVQISSTPEGSSEWYVDTMQVLLNCVRMDVRLITQAARPKIYLPDLSFGIYVRGVDNAPKTLPMNIQNIGTGEISFGDPANPDPAGLLTWADKGFYVDSAEIGMLKDVVLKANESHRINVTFDPVKAYNLRVAAGQPGLGTYRTTARAHANTRDLRDTSVWTAQIIEPVAGVTGGSVEGCNLAVIDGAPGMMRFAYTIAAAEYVRLEVFDAAGERVGLVTDELVASGEHMATWNTNTVPAGTYFCRITAGRWTSTVPFVLLR